MLLSIDALADTLASRDSHLTLDIPLELANALRRLLADRESLIAELRYELAQAEAQRDTAIAERDEVRRCLLPATDDPYFYGALAEQAQAERAALQRAALRKAVRV